MERGKTEATGQETSQGVECPNEESRQEKEGSVQVATQGLIILDVGVLMGSRSPQVLDEMIEIYPGAKTVMDQIEAKQCTCLNPMCKYDTFQAMLENIAGEDKDLAAKFLQAVEDKKAQITKPEELRDFFTAYRHETHKGSWLVFEEGLWDPYPTNFN